MRPASICPARLCQHISEQGTAGSLRPPAGSPCCNHASKEAWVLRQGPGVEMWPPRRSARGQPSPRRQSPPCPAPGAQHRASPSPLLPARPVARQTFARPVQAKGSLAQPGPRGWLGELLPAPTRLRGAAASSRSRTSLRPALLSRGRCRCSRSLPSRYPGNRLPLPRQPTSTVHMAPLSQWVISEFRSSSRVRSPFPG